MPLDPLRIALAVQDGLSVVCATCTKYWDARDRGVPDNRCLAVDGCGSPIAGDVFHEYSGPMTQFDRFCFVCGKEATHALRVNGLVRVIGCCGGHVDIVKDLKPEGRSPVNIVVHSKDATKSSEEMASSKPTIRFRSE